MNKISDEQIFKNVKAYVKEYMCMKHLFETSKDVDVKYDIDKDCDDLLKQMITYIRNNTRGLND